VPTYAYACTACDNRFEVQQSFTDDALTQCPQCAGRVRKLFSSVGIVFKGSGFYRTDSRGGSSNGSTTSESSSSSAKDAGSSPATKDAGASSTPAATSGSSTSSGSAGSSGSTGSGSSKAAASA
jgi:putative FmdB family regulatory protein